MTGILGLPVLKIKNIENKFDAWTLGLGLAPFHNIYYEHSIKFE
jgi:hypothetical protein